MSVENRTIRTSLLRGPVTDIPGLTTYLVDTYLPLAGGTIAGEVFIASGGGLYLYDASTEADVPISVDDGYLLVGGTPLLDNNSTLDASKLGVNTVPDARLSANVARRDQANTFVGINAFDFGSNVDFRIDVSGGAYVAGHRVSGTYRTQFGLYQLKVNSGYEIQFSNSGSNVTTVDTRILRNATGPTLETRSAGGLKVCNADGSAVAAVQCSDITASGLATATNLNAGGSAFYVSASSGRSQLYNNGALGWTAAGTAATSMDTSISRVSAGVLQIGTTSNNALGSLNLVTLNASGNVLVNGQLSGSFLQTNGIIRGSSLFVWRNTVAGKTNMRNWVETSGITLDYSTDGLLNLRNMDDSAAGNLQVGNLTASGVAKFTGYPTGLLPAAASNAGSITYDTTLAKHVGCDGTNWNALW